MDIAAEAAYADVASDMGVAPDCTYPPWQDKRFVGAFGCNPIPNGLCSSLMTTSAPPSTNLTTTGNMLIALRSAL